MSSDELRRRLLGSGLRGGLPPRAPGPHSSGGVRAGRRPGRDFTPRPWSDYFDQKKIVQLDNGDTFVVYAKGSGQATEEPDGRPWLVLLHGGGYSGLTWATFAKEIASKVQCQVLALDLRGHGDTVCAEEEELSAERMARDVCRVVRKMQGPAPAASVILAGHSMGGALAAYVAALEGDDVIAGLVGLVVIDVVEGTAMDALASMQSVLRNRPDRFASLAQAVEWNMRSGVVRNVESARVSVPGQLKSRVSGKCATADVEEARAQSAEPTAKVSRPNAISEEQESSQSQNESFKRPEEEQSKISGYTWRTNLAASEQHWPGWFRGLSERFLSAPTSKLLLLAGVDRLDRELTVGQMQGKFQMQVLPQAGHAVHEDLPDRVADVVAAFAVRNKFAKPVEGGAFKPAFPAL